MNTHTNSERHVLEMTGPSQHPIDQAIPSKVTRIFLGNNKKKRKKKKKKKKKVRKYAKKEKRKRKDKTSRETILNPIQKNKNNRGQKLTLRNFRKKEACTK